jgi:hypothetical protein
LRTVANFDRRGDARLEASALNASAQREEEAHSMIRLTVQAVRSVKMIRPEVGFLNLSIRPLPALAALKPDARAELLDEVRSLTVHDYRLHKDGRPVFEDHQRLGDYFAIDLVSEHWDYAGGECDVLEECYGQRLEYVTAPVEEGKRR